MSSYQSVITDPVALAQRNHPAAGVLLPSAVEFAFHVMGSRREFFDEMRGHIKPEYFTLEERLLAAIWTTMCIVADQGAGPFQFEPLALTLQSHLTNQQEQLSADDLRMAFAADDTGILWTMTTGNYTKEHVTYARHVLKKFLTERTVVSPLRQMLRGPDYPENIGELIDAVKEQSARVAGLQELPRVLVAPVRGETTYRPALVYRKTGVSYVDSVLGGQVAGDCNGLIGITGGGKTSLAVHMAAEGAITCWGEAVKARCHTPEFIAYVSIEEAGDRLTPRVWSAVCSLPLDKLRTMTDWNQLTTQQNIEEYERHILANDNMPVNEAMSGVTLSESDRYDIGQPVMNRCFELLDFSGGGDYQNSGHGYVQEIASALARVQDVRGQPLRSVFVDYAGLLAARSLSSGTADDRKLRMLLSRMGDQFRQIAAKFNCTVWLLHQIRGAAGSQSPLKLVSHFDAAETKDFANNLAVCGCMGTFDPITGCRRLNWSKTRNTRAEGVSPLTLRIHERFARMEDVTDRYRIDEASRTFVSRTQDRQIQQMPTAGPPDLAGGDRGRGRPRVGAAGTQAVLHTAAPNAGGPG